jgi:hypothetical protein
MKRPCIEDLEEAALWLEVNEGPDGESDACARVATWLRSYGWESEMRSAARSSGCSVKYLRKVIQEQRA